MNRILVLALVLICLSLACSLLEFPSSKLEVAPPTTQTSDAAAVPTGTAMDTPMLPAETERAASSPTPSPLDEWALWAEGTELRGANIYQRRVYLELDGTEFLGAGPLGPPYAQEDFDRLADLGANYVNLSHPGLFGEAPPYDLDQDVQDNLDRLLAMAGRADLFAVISFRTGPGRSEFTLLREGAGDWFDSSYINDAVWQDEAAQEAWGDMWRYAAGRYRDNPVVVGYDLMTEPNANEAGIEIWDPQEFHETYAGTLYDWNEFYPQLVAAIRVADPETPILVGALGYSAVDWLPFLRPVEDPHVVYTVHQYAPMDYTHQEPQPELSYPGMMDADWDGEQELIDLGWLDRLLGIVDDFVSEHLAVIAINEFGAVRWAPGAVEFIEDQASLFEQRGWNYALWQWYPDWEPLADGDHSFNYRFGPDPEQLSETDNLWLTLLSRLWSRNTVRPSDFPSP